MNIFEIYLKKIKDLIIGLSKEELIQIPKDLNSINVDIPPEQFDSDISTNVAMVLSKLNQTNPLELAKIKSNLETQRISYVPEGKYIRYERDENNYARPIG